MDLKTYNNIHEGNWGAWLRRNGKLNSFTWIRNLNSANVSRDQCGQKIR